MADGLEIVKVDCRVRNSIPEPNENITEIIDIEIWSKHIKSFVVYPREKKDCPFNRGSWMIEFTLHDGRLECIKLPREMEPEAVLKYCEPLIILLEKMEHGVH